MLMLFYYLSRWFMCRVSGSRPRARLWRQRMSAWTTTTTAKATIMLLRTRTRTRIRIRTRTRNHQQEHQRQEKQSTKQKTLPGYEPCLIKLAASGHLERRAVCRILHLHQLGHHALDPRTVKVSLGVPVLEVQPSRHLGRKPVDGLTEKNKREKTGEKKVRKKAGGKYKRE